jgi:hypothetical protein
MPQVPDQGDLVQEQVKLHLLQFLQQPPGKMSWNYPKLWSLDRVDIKVAFVDYSCRTTLVHVTNIGQKVHAYNFWEQSSHIWCQQTIRGTTVLVHHKWVVHSLV